MHIDENGDAAGNYTILGRKLMNNNKTNETTYGLFPIGTFITTSVENKNNIPVSGTLTFKEITFTYFLCSSKIHNKKSNFSIEKRKLFKRIHGVA